MPTQKTRAKITLRVGGKEHSDWQSYRIDSDFLIPADAFNVDIGLAANHGQLQNYAGQSASVSIDGELVMTGIIDDCRHSLSKGARTFSLSGRDKASLLLDCSSPITNVKGLTMMAAIEKIAKPLGIAKIKRKGGQNPIVDRVDIEPGECAWNSIKRLANFAGLHPWCDPDGTLMISGADYSRPAVATLLCNQHDSQNNVKRIEITHSVRERYSEVVFLGQAHTRSEHRGQHDLKWHYQDPTTSLYKPLTVVVGDANDLSSLKKHAKKQLSDWRLAGFDLHITVAGCKTDDGVLWQPGQRIHVVADEFCIDAIYFLIGRQFSLSRQNGTITELRLKEDGVWTPDAYCKSKKHKRKRELISL